ncbi:WD40 repeat protein [Kribbella amoyensis]|uniref:WD40 repeat protein n=1 Tax=Kribbella amoyensis TaxID=996641 RepID=A0A561BKM5_9ACTN|nr:choice-of-anchor D domain-containing protein [Kribbella amoyensis]TWD79383.1 WD40 repeat protein [Kribbella amoyensis]
MLNRRSGRLFLALALLLVPVAVTTAPTAAATSRGTTEVVSLGADGADSAGSALSPALSADGSQVAFASRAALDPVVRGGTDAPYNVYVRDRRAPGRTVLISRALQATYIVARGSSAPLRATATPEEGGNRDSLHPTVSATGRYVAFESIADNLRDNFGRAERRVVVCDRDPDGDGVFDELRPDGIMDFGYLYLGSDPADPQVTTGSEPSLSADGTVIAWREMLPGATTARVAVTRLVQDPQGRPLPPDPDGFRYPEVDGNHGPPQLSANGHEAVFAVGGCPALLACAEPIGSIQAYDIAADLSTRVDVTPDGSFSGVAAWPAVSGSGRLIAYEHSLQPGGPRVTVVVDRDPAGIGRLGPGADAPVSATVASRDTTDRPAEGTAPALSADGRYLAFQSSADGMHPDAQGTGRTAVVVRDLVLDARREKAGAPRLPGELGSPSGQLCGPQVCPAAGPSESPRLSANGSVLVFTSAGDDLVSPPCCVGAAVARTFQPQVTASTTVFDGVPVGRSATKTAVVRHEGFGPLTIGRLSVTGSADFVTGMAENCVGATLHADETCSVTVEFTPTSVGTKEAALRVELRNGAVTDLPLRGSSTALPTVPPPTQPTPGPTTAPTPTGGLVINPDPVDFTGSLPALVPIGVRSVQVRNGATTPIELSAVEVLSGPRFTPGDFTVVSTTCSGRRLDPGDICSVEVRATPQSPGRRTGVLSIATKDPAYTRLIALSSQAVAPVLVVNPAVVRTNRVTTVAGRDFPPGRAVTVVVTTPGTRLRTTAVAGSTGEFSAALLVFPQTSTGTWPVEAVVDGTTIRARSTVLVVPGSFQPPDFTSRR